MRWHQITGLYQESFRFCFSKRLFLLAYPTVALCLIIIALFLFVARQVSGFSQLLFSVFPLIICCGLLTIMGTKLLRTLKCNNDTYKKVRLSSKTLLASQLPVLATLLAYISIVLIFGLFFLLKHLPLIGFILHLFSYPALIALVMSLLLLLFLLAFSLFTAPPLLAEVGDVSLRHLLSYCRQIQDRALEYLVYFALASIPFFVVICFNILCISIISHVVSEGGALLNYLMTAFFLSALITPSIVFFFYFSEQVGSMLRPFKRV